MTVNDLLGGNLLNCLECNCIITSVNPGDGDFMVNSERGVASWGIRLFLQRLNHQIRML